MEFKATSFIQLPFRAAISVFLSIHLAPVLAQDNALAKPRVIAMTDGEVDDRCSMVRFLLHTNDIEVLAIIQTNSVYQRKGWVAEKWLEKQVDAYAQVYPNLVVHDLAYPSPDYLRTRIFVGDNDSSHITVDFNSPARIPGQKPTIDPSKWKDTEGSDKIVEILLDKDPRKVHLQAWGGGNTAARAFYKIKTQYPREYQRAIAKVVMYNIWYQDGAGSYIEKEHPGVTMLLCHYFNSTWAYGAQAFTSDFVAKKLRNHPLGRFYTQDYISEGDSPAFLYALGNGLRSDEDPTYGGWGGRFYKVAGFKNVYRDADRASYALWIEAANREFEMRLAWCLSPTYVGANHKPVIRLQVARNITVRSGEKVILKAEVTDNDPIDYKGLWEKYKAVFEQQGVTFDGFRTMMADRPKASAVWWQYQEAGTYPGRVDLGNNESTEVSFIAPAVNAKQTLHFILEAADNSAPAQFSYERVIVTVMPASGR